MEKVIDRKSKDENKEGYESTCGGMEFPELNIAIPTADELDKEKENGKTEN